MGSFFDNSKHKLKESHGIIEMMTTTQLFPSMFTAPPLSTRLDSGVHSFARSALSLIPLGVRLQTSGREEKLQRRRKFNETRVVANPLIISHSFDQPRNVAAWLYCSEFQRNLQRKMGTKGCATIKLRRYMTGQ